MSSLHAKPFTRAIFYDTFMTRLLPRVDGEPVSLPSLSLSITLADVNQLKDSMTISTILLTSSISRNENNENNGMERSGVKKTVPSSFARMIWTI